MKIETVLIGAALLILVMFIGQNLLSDTADIYHISTGVDNRFDDITEDMEQTKEYAEDMRSKVQGETITTENAVDDMVAGGFKGIRFNPLGAAGVISNVTTEIGIETGIFEGESGAAIYSFLTYALLVLVLLAVVLFIFRLVPGSR